MRSEPQSELDTDFLLIPGDCPVDQALALLAKLRPARALVRDDGAGAPRYYLFERAALHARLAHRPGERLREALGLSALPALAVRGRPPAKRDTPAVIIDRGQVLGLALPRVAVLRSPADPPLLAFPSTGASMPATAPEPRTLLASAPPEVQLGTEASLLVRLGGEGEPGGLGLMIAAGQSVEVVLQASGGVSIKGKAEGTLTAATDGDTLPLRFKLLGASLGPGRVAIYAFQDGLAVGSLAVSVEVVAQAEETNPQEQSEPIHPVVPVPDLSLLVLENRGDRSYSMRLSAPDPQYGLNFKPFGPITLQLDPEKFFAELFADIERILVAQSSTEEKMAALGAKGSYLFDRIVPEPLRTALWSLRGRVRSVQIQSEEPWIPWELCKLAGPDSQGAIVEGGFLCEEFEVTRWLLEVTQRLELSLGTIGLVVPAGSGLPAAFAERDYMLSLADAQRTVTEIPAQLIALRAALASGKYQGLHFTGHGLFGGGDADRSAIVLENGQKLTPQDLGGVVLNLGRTEHPLVFLNACEVGRAGMSLAGMGGWARGFLRAGAGAFLAPYWKVADGSASAFAQSFYGALLDQGAGVAKAVQQARQEIKKGSDPTWLAYAVYAHPDAKLSSPQG